MAANSQVYSHNEISDDWIEKYRAAMEAVPSEEAHTTQSSSFLDRAAGRMTAASKSIANKWRQFVAQ
jgi:hypothetical protein